jgi:ABC-type Fe3+ transport system permease subunit
MKGGRFMIFSMSIWFGLIFALCGLVLAVLLGIVLYRDPQAKVGPIEKPWVSNRR